MLEFRRRQHHRPLRHHCSETVARPPRPPPHSMPVSAPAMPPCHRVPPAAFWMAHYSQSMCGHSSFMCCMVLHGPASRGRLSCWASVLRSWWSQYGRKSSRRCRSNFCSEWRSTGDRAWPIILWLHALRSLATSHCASATSLDFPYHTRAYVCMCICACMCTRVLLADWCTRTQANSLTGRLTPENF